MNELLSKFRAPMMGGLIILIMLYHDTTEMMGAFRPLVLRYGPWGVDGFLFLSGFGLYFAQEKKKDGSIWMFYARRLFRIIPAALIVGWSFYLMGGAHLLAVLGLNQWFIRSILILYLGAPLVYKMLQRMNPTKVMAFFISIGIVGVLMISPYMKDLSFSWQTTISWTIARMPVFVLGMYVARMEFNVQKILHSVYSIVAIVALVVALYVHRYPRLISTYAHLLPFIILAISIPLLLVLLGGFFRYIQRGFFMKSLSFMGGISLELYLIHEPMKLMISRWNLSPIETTLIVTVLTIVSAWALHVFVTFFSRFAKKFTLKM